MAHKHDHQICIWIYHSPSMFKEVVYYRVERENYKDGHENVIDCSDMRNLEQFSATKDENNYGYKKGVVIKKIQKLFI